MQSSMSRTETHVTIGALIVAVILLLLFAHKGNTYVTQQKLGDVRVSPNISEFSVAPMTIKDLPPFKSGVWDWMQTTNLGCDCSEGNAKTQQIFLPPPPAPRQTMPAFVFVSPPPASPVLPSIYSPPWHSAPVYNYPAFTPPVFTYSKRSNGIFFMTFTDGTGPVNDGSSLPLFVIQTSDGEILNAYNRRFSSGRSGSIVYGATTYYPASDSDRI